MHQYSDAISQQVVVPAGDVNEIIVVVTSFFLLVVCFQDELK